MYKLLESDDGQFYFTFCNRQNGKVLMTSEMYKNKRNATLGMVAAWKAAGSSKEVMYTNFHGYRGFLKNL